MVPPDVPRTTPKKLRIDVASASTDVEEARAFLERRLGIFAGWVFGLSFGFYLVNLGIAAWVDPGLAVYASSWLHLAASVVAGGIWLIARRRALSLEGLWRLDAGGIIVICLLFALMGAALARLEPARSHDQMGLAFSVALLACAHTVIFRAVAVPSTPLRTAWISIASLVPVVTLTGLFGGRMHLVDAPLPVHVISTASWAGVTTAIAVVASDIIFGLRREAAKIRRLGQYTLEEKIGEGGMGVVYRARHGMLRRPTAIKLLPPDRAGEESIRRFEREVQLTAQLSHPSTIAIFDYGRTPQGLFYYAMEYLEGLTLEQLVSADGPQPDGRVIHILVQVCGALAEAHGIGLIHRDIKPANIILAERGGMPDVAKVVDFGLVKHVAPAADQATVALTAANVLTGTPHYLAPEAIRGERFIDARSDLYALGAVGYFLLAGVPVFEADSLVEIFAHHLHTTPVAPSKRTNRPVLAELERLIMACLAKNPADRPHDARTLGRLLACCPCAVSWTTEQASAWWEAYRARTAPRAVNPLRERVPGSDEVVPTLSVDLSNRTGR